MTLYMPVGMMFSSETHWQRELMESSEREFSTTTWSIAWHGTKFERPPRVEDALHPLLHNRNLSRWASKQVLHYMNESPANWFTLAIDGLHSGRTVFIWTILVSVLGCLLLPACVLLTIGFTVSAHALTFAHEAFEEPGASEQNAEFQTDWDGYIHRLQHSTNPKEQKLIFNGIHATEDYPVFSTRSILNEHGHMLGDSGSGKTALGLAPLLIQLTRAGDGAVVVIDLKGDRFMLQTLYREAMRAGREFKVFSNVLHMPTHVFNPFLQPYKDILSHNQEVQGFMNALGLEHGAGYGAEHFSSAHRHALLTIMEEVGDSIQSFADLYEQVTDENRYHSDKHREDAFDLRAKVQPLVMVPQLNATPSGIKVPKRSDTIGGRANKNRVLWDEIPLPQSVLDASISFPDVLAKKQVVYFWLEAGREEATVREVSKLALFALFASAVTHQQKTGKVAPAYLVIDEFQRAVSSNLGVLLEQARSFGIHAMLANQNIKQLVTRDTDLTETVESLRFKQIFAATGREQREYLSKISGESLYELQSGYIDEEGAAVSSWREQILPRLQSTDISRFSNYKDTSFLHIARSDSYAQYSGLPFPIRGLYATTEHEYEARRTAPWPELPGEMLIADRDGFSVLEDQLQEQTIHADRNGASPQTAEAAPKNKRHSSPLASHLQALYSAQQEAIREHRG